MKKFLLIMIFSIMLILSFSFATVEEDSASTLVKMNLMAGYPDGTLKLENNITRAEFCTLVTKMLGYNENPIEITTKKSFSDMKKSHWAYNSVMTATQLNFLSGYEDNTFRPSNNITYAEVSSILIKVLGRGDDLEGNWPDNVVNLAEELKLNKNVEAEAKDKLTRGQVSVMLINAMGLPIK